MNTGTHGHSTTLRVYAPLAMKTKTLADPAVWLWGLGLAGETFELLRALDGDGDVTLESGDVLWYCVAIATDAGFLGDFIHHFEHHPDIADSVRTSLYQAVGDAVEHIKKANRAGSAYDRDVLVPALSKVARTLYWIAVDRSLVWSSIMDRNIEKLTRRKYAGTVGATSRPEGT